MDGLGFEELRAAAAAKGKSDNECIQVVVRCRPINEKEIEEKRETIINIDCDLGQVDIQNPAMPNETPKAYTFDGAFDEFTQQRPFYDESCFLLVESVLEGFNATVFAYGQTGCGKSFSMQGPPSPPEMKGVIPNAFAHLFDFVRSTKDVEFLVRCSYLEIYNEEIHDLLCGPKSQVKCEIKEDKEKGIFVKNLTEMIVDSEEKMLATLDKGLAQRTVASTLMNLESSRSHSIFTLIVEMSTKNPDTGKDMLRVGKLNLVDLAGSERQKKTGTTGLAQKEGIQINKSLTSLGIVIQALAEGKGGHVPYRDSKLTRMLQDSLGGNTKTLMIAAISPADYNYDETMSTLRYANRAKNIKNKPKINEDPKDALLRGYKEEIEMLRKLLGDAGASMTNGGAALQTLTSPPSVSAPVVGIAMASSAGAVDDATASPEVDQTAAAVAHLSPPGVSVLTHPADPQIIEKIVIQKEYIHVESDVLGQHQELQQAHELLANERDYAHEQLLDKDHEIVEEKGRIEALNERLRQLQSKLLGNGGSTNEVEIEMSNLSVKQEKDNEKAREVYEETKLRLKAKREKKKLAEKQKVANDKAQMENEIEELRQSLQDQSDSNKKIAKMRKKYEKRIGMMKAEMEDLQQEHALERNRLLETNRELACDCQLYEQICQNLLSAGNFKKVVEKCRWDDDACVWLLPALKQKDVSEAMNLPQNGHGFQLPSINSKGSTTREGSASTSRDQIPPAGALLQRFSPRQPVESDSPRISALSARGEALPSFHTQTQLSHSYNNNENMCIPTLDLSNPLSNGHGYPVAHSLDTGMALNDPTNPTKPPRVKSAKKDKRAKKTIPKKELSDEEVHSGRAPEVADGRSGHGLSDWGFNDHTVGYYKHDRYGEPVYSDDEDFQEGQRGPGLEALEATGKKELKKRSKSSDGTKRKKVLKDNEGDPAGGNPVQRVLNDYGCENSARLESAIGGLPSMY